MKTWFSILNNNITAFYAFNTALFTIFHQLFIYLCRWHNGLYKKRFCLYLWLNFQVLIHKNTQDFIYSIKNNALTKTLQNNADFSTLFWSETQSSILNSQGIKMFYNTFVRLHFQQKTDNRRLFLIFVLL